MKNRKINLIKLGVLFFVTSFFLWNCEEKESFPEENLQNQEIDIKGYRITSLENIPKLIPTIKNIKRIKPKKNQEFARNLSFLNDIENLNTDEVIVYTDETGYTTYNFKFNNSQQTINFENLHLLEEENGGSIGYILSYEPDSDWYYSHLNDEGKLNFDISTYQGEITKYSLEREIIWSTKGVENTQSRGGTWVEVCTISLVPTAPVDVCDGCANGTGQGYVTVEGCSTFYVQGGVTSDVSEGAGGSSDDSNGGTTGNTDGPCNNTTGTSVVNDQPISGVSGGCAPNNNGGVNTNNTPLVSFYQDLNYQQQQFLSANQNIYSQIGIYLDNNNFSPQAQNIAIEIITLSSNLRFIELPMFDAINNPWLSSLREYAKRLEELKSVIPEQLWDAMNKNLDKLLTTALTKTALKLNSDAHDESDIIKNDNFDNFGVKAVGTLLYEFANGEGPDDREFKNGNFWTQFFEGDRKTKIKADFENVLVNNNLTFNQFVANGNMLPSSYRFSPDHAGAVNSFEEHKNANWVQFFVGGSAVEYRPSSQTGYIDVKLINPTGRKSLLLHVGDNYIRDGSGQNLPLSTIYQYFYITIKIR